MMIRLHLIVEGQTEETYVNSVLKPHLSSFEIYADARRVETSHKQRKYYRGGLIDYQRARNDIDFWIREDPDAYFTTMFDLYALPEAFPRYDDAKKEVDHWKKVHILEDGLQEEIDYWRFVPYIQLYEFEALLFSNPREFDWEFIDHEKQIQELIGIRDQFDSPEEINDDRKTAPSKRIISVIPEYKSRKASAGPLIASKIGLDELRKQCSHFDEWLRQLENLGASSAGTSLI